jgi:hypothetical protein
MLGVFLFCERRAAEPFLPLSLFERSRWGGGRFA